MKCVQAIDEVTNAALERVLIRFKDFLSLSLCSVSDNHVEHYTKKSSSSAASIHAPDGYNCGVHTM